MNPQAEETREEHIKYLRHHINFNTTHLLLEAPCNNTNDPCDGGTGTSTSATDRNDFLESLSEAQLTRVRNQAICVRAYLVMIDRNHPEWSVARCAAEVAEIMGIASGTTIANWFREYANNGNKFKRDGRGLDAPDWILDQLTTADEEPVTFELIFRQWCRANLKTLSVRAATDFLNDELFKDTPMATFKRFHISAPIGPSTAWNWMHRVGCEMSSQKKNFYTDRHEAPDVVAYRNDYVARDLEREKRQPLWIQLTKEEASAVRADMEKAGGKLNPGHVYVHGGASYEEFHVDDSDAFLSARAKFAMGGNLSVRFPAGAKPLLRMGQDESIYKAFQFPSRSWACDGATVLLLKTEGVGDMVSAFTDTALGFGLKMTDEQLATVNANRRGAEYLSAESAIAINGTASKPELTESPGIRFLEYGKNKEGYWNFDRMALQMEDVLDCVEVVYGAGSSAVADARRRAPPGIAVDWSRGFVTLQEMDWSSGHGRTKPDGLNANNMNEKFGGAQPRMHTTKVSAEDLGPYEAKVKWIPRFSTRKPVLRDCKLKPGSEQHMIFQPDDLPPHYALDTPKEDVFLGHQKAQKKRGRSKAADDTTEQPAAETIMVDAINPGYVDKAKGLRQVLWERGWLCPGKKYTMKGIVVNGTVDPSSSLVQIMANCSDFRNERTLMEELVDC